eukprot:m.211983 g.211983  ORF g.211983 m.211983 type:complete len:50 (+) comp15068_c1_seq7:132-281(+)
MNRERAVASRCSENSTCQNVDWLYTASHAHKHNHARIGIHPLHTFVVLS